VNNAALSDLLDGLDDLVGGGPPSNLDGDAVTGDEDERMSDSVEDDTAGEDSQVEEEWAGVSNGEQGQEGGSGRSDSDESNLVLLVDPSPTQAISRS
jgi:hypothetical protein